MDVGKGSLSPHCGAFPLGPLGLAQHPAEERGPFWAALQTELGGKVPAQTQTHTDTHTCATLALRWRKG